MLATAGEPFDHPDWLFELKYDGYRLIIDKSPNSVVLRSRNGHDLTARFPDIARSAERCAIITRPSGSPAGVARWR